MRKIIYIFLLLINIKAVSQTFNSGYIISENGDSIPGYILDQIDNEMQFKIEFKNSIIDNSSISYSPEDILGFGFDYGRTFEQQSVAKGNKDTLKVFAKRIVQGRINLYMNSNQIIANEELFLKNNNLDEVVHIKRPKKEIVTRPNGSKYSYQSKIFIGFLNYIVSDVPNYKIYNDKERFSTKKIINRIKEYNSLFSKDYSTSNYIEQRKFRYDLTIGIPINWNINGTQYKSAFRVALYRNKIFPETTRKLSYISGFSYRYGSSLNNYNSTNRQHFISIIPLGLNYHRSKGLIRPYAYFGLGVTFLIQPLQIVDEASIEESPRSIQTFLFLFGFNLGAGVKVKVGSKFLNFEITPTGNGGGVFLNVGLTI